MVTPNILITGISGQLGNRLSEMLKEMNIPHRGISRDKNYKTDVPYLCKDILNIPKLELEKFIKPVTHVIHLADVINDNKDFENKLEKQFKNCCISTIKLLNCLHKNIKHFTFASSYSVYGSPESLPLTEESLLNPENIYSFSKLFTENYLSFYKKTCIMPIAVLRISSIYGPGPKRENYNRAIPTMIETVLDGNVPYVNNDGNTFRDYMFIDDCIGAIIKASLSEVEGIFNIASGKGTSIKEIAENIIDIAKIDKKPENRYDMEIEWNSVCDITKMKNVIQYTPKFSIREGLEITYNWHKEQR